VALGPRAGSSLVEPPSCDSSFDRRLRLPLRQLSEPLPQGDESASCCKFLVRSS